MGDEREMAKALAVTKNPEPELMFEGQEKGSFWSDLGGKQDYFTDLVSRQEDDVPEPRLFQLSSATGNITVEEVVDFSQEDLIEEDVVILDAGHSVFAWFGALSTRQEQQESVRIARDYLESCPNDRDPETLYSTQSDQEPDGAISNGHSSYGGSIVYPYS